MLEDFQSNHSSQSLQFEEAKRKRVLPSVQRKNHQKQLLPRPFSIQSHRDMSPLRDCIVRVHAQIDLSAQILRPGSQGKRYKLGNLCWKISMSLVEYKS